MRQSALLVAAGFAAGVAGMGAIAVWGSSPQAYAYTVSCRPEGVKTDITCKVVKEGKFGRLDSGWYINAEAHYPDWKVALGAECSDRYREYRDYADTTWKKAGDDMKAFDLARSDARFYFDCYNRVQS